MRSNIKAPVDSINIEFIVKLLIFEQTLIISNLLFNLIGLAVRYCRIAKLSAILRGVV